MSHACHRTKDPPYGYTAHLPGVPFDQARSRIVDALKNEGFGELTQIDVKSTLKAKLERDFRRQVNGCDGRWSRPRPQHEPVDYADTTHGRFSTADSATCCTDARRNRDEPWLLPR